MTEKLEQALQGAENLSEDKLLIMVAYAQGLDAGAKISAKNKKEAEADAEA